jgi:hypothetical protein
MGPLLAELCIGLRRHPHVRCSFGLSCSQLPRILALSWLALGRVHRGPQLCAPASHGVWSNRSRVATAQGLTVGSRVGVVMAIKGCAECLKKQRAINRLTEELLRLKQKLRYQERQAMEGFFGLATASAKRSVKTNTPPPPAPKPKGARPGHAGVGRHTFDAHQAERVIELPPVGGARCPAQEPLWESIAGDGHHQALSPWYPLKVKCASRQAWSPGVWGRASPA